MGLSPAAVTCDLVESRSGRGLSCHCFTLFIMKTFGVCCVQVCLLVYFVTHSGADPSDKEPKRSRMISYALTPSLRVGRRTEGTWDRNTDVKRKMEKIMSFMRTGRSGPRGFDDFDVSKRTGSNNGMWFGPRLGRVQKRAISDDYTPWTYIIFNGEGPVSRQVHYTPRLGRESDEITDDDLTNGLTTA